MKTFAQIYEDLDPVPPKTRWIRRIAKATCKAEQSVKNWLAGRAVPDELTQKIIAEELGVPVEGLFPAKN